MVLHPPNWHTVQRITIAELWEWVAWSCNLDRRCVIRTPDTDHEPRYRNRLPSFEEMQFQERLEIARRHARKGGLLRVEEPGPKDILASVHIDAFLTLARSLNWALPDGFPRGSSEITTTANEVAGDHDWAGAAKEHATRVCLRYRQMSADPTEEDIAREVAQLLERDGFLKKNGDPRDWQTVKRHGLKGWTRPPK